MQIALNMKPIRSKPIAECCLNGGGIMQMATPGAKTSYSEFDADIPTERSPHTRFKGSADH